MTRTEIRSQLAFQQAALAILSDHARALDEMPAVGAIDQAGELLRAAFDRLDRETPDEPYQPGAWFGRVGEAAPE